MLPALTWSVPDAFPALDRDEIHVWCAWLDEPALSASPADLLSADELARARAFHFEGDRRRFLAARTVLRRLLGAYLGTPASRLRFTYGPYGKPALNPAWLQFNLSHSGPLGLFAVCHHRQVGVDIEENRELADLELIGTRVFTPAETEQQRTLDPAARRHEFYRRWTRREATGKCSGVGLNDGRAGTADSSPPPQTQALDPAEGFVGSIAYDGEPTPLRRFRFASAILPPSAYMPIPATRSRPEPVPGSIRG